MAVDMQSYLCYQKEVPHLQNSHKVYAYMQKSFEESVWNGLIRIFS
jgi:hypothetical protein